jgi:hypothetical protein
MHHVLIQLWVLVYGFKFVPIWRENDAVNMRFYHHLDWTLDRRRYRGCTEWITTTRHPCMRHDGSQTDIHMKKNNKVLQSGTEIYACLSLF